MHKQKGFLGPKMNIAAMDINPCGGIWQRRDTAGETWSEIQMKNEANLAKRPLVNFTYTLQTL